MGDELDLTISIIGFIPFMFGMTALLDWIYIDNFNLLLLFVNSFLIWILAWFVEENKEYKK